MEEQPPDGRGTRVRVIAGTAPGRLADDAFLRELAEDDRRLLAAVRSASDGGNASAGGVPSTASWPPLLADDLRCARPAELKQRHWLLERHYSAQLRAVRSLPEIDALTTIAYSRVIDLRLQYTDELGFDDAQRDFVLAALAPLRRRRGDALSVLEVGCGVGALLEDLERSGLREVSGIDIAPAAVDEARRRAARRGSPARIWRAAPWDLLGQGGSGANYDAIIACDVLEHIPLPAVDAFLTSVSTLLRPGGSLVLVTPNALSGPHDLTSDFAPDARTPLGLHLHEYRLAELRRHLRRAGFGRFRSVSMLRSLVPGAAPSTSMGSFWAKCLLELPLAPAPRRLRRLVVERLYWKGLVCTRL